MYFRRRRKGVLPPDWVMKRIRCLRSPLLNKAEIARRIGKSRDWVIDIVHEPFRTSQTTYNLIAELFKWPQWDDDDN